MNNRFFYIIIIFILLIAYQLSGQIISGTTSTDLFEKPASAIFLKFIGAELKPIYLIFISTVKTPQEKLMRMVKLVFNVEPFRIEQFKVSKPDLNKIIYELKEHLPQTQKALSMSEEMKAHIHDKVIVVGIIENNKMTTKTISREEFRPICLNIQRETKNKYIDLHNTMVEFFSRTGQGPGQVKPLSGFNGVASTPASFGNTGGAKHLPTLAVP